MNIRDRIKTESGQYPLYNVRIDKYKKDGIDIPFRVATQPFKLTKTQKQELDDIGYLICDYIEAVKELYNSNEKVKSILDKGKPDIYLKKQDPKYLFLRPDLILTQNRFFYLRNRNFSIWTSIS